LEKNKGNKGDSLCSTPIKPACSMGMADRGYTTKLQNEMKLMSQCNSIIWKKRKGIWSHDIENY